MDSSFAPDPNSTTNATTNATTKPAANVSTNPSASSKRDAALDVALDLLRDSDHVELSTHGPMAAEALCDLGFSERAADWARAYRTDLHPIPRSERQPPPDWPRVWRAALGDTELRSHWLERFDAELASAGFRAVARRWLPRLLPGMSCEAAHALIRTGHALRSLSASETPARTHELAEALAYWAACYEPLPGSPAGRGATSSSQAPSSQALPSQAIQDITTIPTEEQTYGGLVTDRLRMLLDRPRFGEEVSRTHPGEDLAGFADDLARTAARLYLANAARARVIDFIHALDGVVAVRELLPHLEAEDARHALFYGWQLVAALHAVAGGPLDLPPHRTPEPEEIDGLVLRAVEIGGVHAIKFAQACVREHTRKPNPLFVAALLDMVERMEQLKRELGLVI